MRFLIADDDFYSRSLLQKLLSSSGSCDVVVDGEEAVEAFKDSILSNKPYDLICMDIIMPNMDGQKALQEIRAIERENNIDEKDQVKAMIVSSLDDAREVHDAFFLGSATSYMVKPIRKQALLGELESLCM